MIRQRRPGSRSIALAICSVVLMSLGCGDDDDVVGPLNLLSAIPGARARDFLSAAEYSALTVQVQPVEGMEPDPATVDNVRQFLQDRLNKPAGIQIDVATAIPSPGKAEYSIADIRQIERDSRTAFSSGGVIAAYLLLVDGESDQSNGSSRILGHAYGATSMVIYESAIQELSGGIGEPSREALETTVVNHEFGHILGLVDTGSPPQDPAHHDQSNGAHCTNTNCLMHHSVDVSDVVANLLGGSIPALDADCIDDLRANGGK